MKKFALLLALVAFIFSSCNKGGAPKDVKAKFDEMYKGATEVAWAKQDDGNYLATFKFEEGEWTALFGADGMWLKSTKKLDETTFPAKGVEYLKLFYEGQTPSYSMVKDSIGETYLAEMTKEENKMEVFFDMNGKVIKDENNAVFAKFMEKYPSATDAAWSKKEDGNFLVSFNADGKAWTSAFAADGNWLYSENILKQEEYPEAIANYFKKMKGVEVKEVKMKQTAEKDAYEVLTAFKDVETCFIFDKDGKFIEKMDLPKPEAQPAAAAEEKK
ncbi:MAG TPA: PepSY-like domain-containing protein [Bacteroidia bacterium]|nr:PepSY-like domain-containing protein [Bacteroidia bacterium]HRS59309.1 PepSY-like domain-containing protein [Bacteroidia bacterium]HRU68249.1 PepSY-like domain-containing protein [Bacteroidia bacterium]